MPEYVLNRNYIHRSTMGFTVAFKKGEPTFVPQMIEREVRAFGAERVDGNNVDVLDPETKVVSDPTGDDREALLVAAFDELVERNNSKDFTGSGAPNMKAVEKIVGFDVDKTELVEAWNAYRIAKAEAEAQ